MYVEKTGEPGDESTILPQKLNCKNFSLTTNIDFFNLATTYLNAQNHGKLNLILCVYFRLQEKQAASNEKRTTHRTEKDDLPALMPSSKRLKRSEEGASTATDQRHRTQDSSSLDRHKSKREDDRKTRSKLRKDADNDRKRKKSKEKIADEVTREMNWLSSNLRVRIIDQEYKKGKFYNTKVTYIC